MQLPKAIPNIPQEMPKTTINFLTFSKMGV
jgi:hypothetical protein